MSLLGLFFLFMYIGLSTIGGGLVAVSLMQQELVARSIISSEQFIAMIAVSESTPGPIGINMATYIGYELYGIWGSLVLTTGIVLPSLIVIVLIARFAQSFQNAAPVKNTMYGLRAGAAGMIAAAAWNVLAVAVFTLPAFHASRQWTELVDWKAAAVFCLFLLVQVLFKRLHPIFLILVGAVVGIVLF